MRYQRLRSVLTIAATVVGLLGCSSSSVNVSQSFGALGGAVAATSPILTVISIVQAGVDVIGSGHREYVVTIRSTEMNQEEAVKQAFAEACSVTFGSTVATELESSNGRLTRDSVVSYSGCYVKSHHIESRVREPSGEVTVVVAVTVTSDKLSGRLLGNSQIEAGFNGQQHADRIESYQKSMSNSDRLVELVLRDFPERAYQIEIAKIQTKVKPDRSGYVRVDYLISLDDNFVDALRDLFDKTGTIPSGKILGAYPLGKWGVSNPVAEVVVPGFMSETTYQFTDRITYDKIRAGLTKPQLLLVYTKTGGKYSRLNDGDWRIFSCVPAAWNNSNPLLSLGPRGGRIGPRPGVKKIWYAIDLTFKNESELDFLSHTSDLKFEVSDKNCPKLN